MVCLVVPEGDPTSNDEWRTQFHILLLIICKTEGNSSEQNIPWQHGSRQKQRRFVGTTGGVWGWSDLGPMVSIVWEGGPAVRGKTIRAQIIWGLCQCPAYPFSSSPSLSLFLNRCTVVRSNTEYNLHLVFVFILCTLFRCIVGDVMYFVFIFCVLKQVYWGWTLSLDGL